MLQSENRLHNQAETAFGRSHDSIVPDEAIFHLEGPDRSAQMKLCEQRDNLKTACLDTIEVARALQSKLLRKINSPFPDGTKSDMVNATTDVLPELERIIAGLENTMWDIEQ